ncbi:hypothetical protein AB0C27_40605 [Nonomuraea sp. NPDC048882]|uniref:hypothetical protein n=1 Tax=Nonomuraea sp. NPDC048882 TaxID=3154347 RepID=UPI0033F18A5C
MIRDTRFLISRRPYAVDLASLRGSVKTTGPGATARTYYDGRINAVWYRRRRGVTVACIGTLWDLQDDQPADAVQFLGRHTDGRYGGNAEGRWDGRSYWGNGTLAEQQQFLAILRPMLAGYPEAPAGFDGWWRF